MTMRTYTKRQLEERGWNHRLIKKLLRVVGRQRIPGVVHLYDADSAERIEATPEWIGERDAIVKRRRDYTNGRIRARERWEAWLVAVRTPGTPEWLEEREELRQLESYRRQYAMRVAPGKVDWKREGF